MTTSDRLRRAVDDARLLPADQMLALTCGFCGATPGEWCRTSSGYKSQHLHADRFYQWKATQ